MRLLSVKKRYRKIGLPPGTLLYTGDDERKDFSAQLIKYDAERFEEEKFTNLVPTISTNFEDSEIRWFNFDNIRRVDIVEDIGKQFDLHPLLLEDCVNPDQRPKVENYEKYLFIVIKMLTWEPKNFEVDSEQVSIVLGDKWVLSFQEEQKDLFEPIRERLRKKKRPDPKSRAGLSPLYYR